MPQVPGKDGDWAGAEPAAEGAASQKTVPEPPVSAEAEVGRWHLQRENGQRPLGGLVAGVFLDILKGR
jgi:hypothetical protein